MNVWDHYTQLYTKLNLSTVEVMFIIQYNLDFSSPYQRAGDVLQAYSPQLCVSCWLLL